jgi:hypothetical protein
MRVSRASIVLHHNNSTCPNPSKMCRTDMRTKAGISSPQCSAVTEHINRCPGVNFTTAHCPVGQTDVILVPTATFWKGTPTEMHQKNRIARWLKVLLYDSRNNKATGIALFKGLLEPSSQPEPWQPCVHDAG